MPRRLVGRPHLSHCLEHLASVLHLGPTRQAHHLELDVERALGSSLSDAQLEPAVAQDVDVGDLLRGADWLPVGEAQHCQSEADVLGDAGQVGEIRDRLHEQWLVVITGRRLREGLPRAARNVYGVQQLVPDEIVMPP